MNDPIRAAGFLVLLLSVMGAFAQENGMNGSQDPGMMMGGGMLGETAETVVLAEGRLESRPEGPSAWTLFDLGRVGENVSLGVEAPAFLYAHEGMHTWNSGGEERTLQEGRAAYVAPEADVSVSSEGGLWLVVLAEPGVEAPAGVGEAEVLSSSGALEGIPDGPVQASFVLVDLPMGARTAVHQHPGPEYVYVTEGEIEYETGIGEAETLGPGDHRALPAETAVQKRNPMGDPARFLSWFVVDPDRPFASDAVLE